MQDQPRPQ